MDTVTNNTLSTPTKLEIKITDQAKTRIVELLAGRNDLMFRIYADMHSGGCAKILYYFMFEVPETEDLIINYENFNVIVDPITANYVNGITLDYSADTHNEGFRIMNNQTPKTCGCDKAFCC